MLRNKLSFFKSIMIGRTAMNSAKHLQLQGEFSKQRDLLIKVDQEMMKLTRQEEEIYHELNELDTRIEDCEETPLRVKLFHTMQSMDIDLINIGQEREFKSQKRETIQEKMCQILAAIRKECAEAEPSISAVAKK